MIADKKITNPGEGSHNTLLHTTQQLEQPLKQTTEASSAPEQSPVAREIAPATPEQPLATPEQISPTEQAFEEYKQVDDTKPEESPYVIRSSKTKQQPAAPAVTTKSQTVTDIEEIMASDLGSVYQTMTPQQQAKFKAKGEEVAEKIADLITHVGFTVKKVLSLIRDWLKMIPKVNKYFLEQEAKIKADELIKYATSKHSKES